MARQCRLFEIVHSGAAERAVGQVEACRLDHVDGKAQTGGQAQDRSGIAGNIRLVEGNSQVGHRWLVEVVGSMVRFL